jgi:ABC-type dipeptide/oligopeptide/nickel transport system permease component
VRLGFWGFLLRRAALAVLLVLLVSSASLWLITVAPGDHLSGFDLDPEIAAAERRRLKLDRPFLIQYAAWLGRAARLDFGDSLKYGRPVAALVGERAQNTALLGAAALMVATLVGIPAGILTGSRRGPFAALARSVSIVFVSLPPLVTSFVLLLIASRTGWLPVGGFAASDTSSYVETVRYLVLPCLALAVPLAATLERLQSQAIGQAMVEPSVRAALARGCSTHRVIWRHALRLALPPVLAVYGVLVGSVLSGSFAVEIVMSWPGLGALTYEALVARDLYLVAGCATAGAAFLAAGVLGSDVALALADPRVGEQR